MPASRAVGPGVPSPGAPVPGASWRRRRMRADLHFAAVALLSGGGFMLLLEVVFLWSVGPRGRMEAVLPLLLGAGLGLLMTLALVPHPAVVRYGANFPKDLTAYDQELGVIAVRLRRRWVAVLASAPQFLLLGLPLLVDGPPRLSTDINAWVGWPLFSWLAAGGLSQGAQCVQVGRALAAEAPVGRSRP